MNNLMESKGGSLGLLGLFLALGIIISAVIVSSTLEKIKLSEEKITVKGYAKKEIISDVAVWKFRVVGRSVVIGQAYDVVKNDTKKVMDFLRSKGISGDKLDVKPITTQTVFKQSPQGYFTNEIAGYQLEQPFEIESKDVNLISDLSKEIATLSNQGVELISMQPEFYYSKLEDLKIELIGKATQNARQRAEEFAKSSDIKVGNMRSASQGIFQITPVNSIEVQDYGMYDTSTIKKSVNAVVTINYAIEN